MGRSLQVSTKLPFLRKCNLYVLFLDWRYFPLDNIPLQKHLSFSQLPKNRNKPKGSKMEIQAPMLKKTKEATLQCYFSFKKYSYFNFKGVYLFRRYFFVNKCF